MTASLPVPHEPPPDDPDDTVEPAEGAEIGEIPKPARAPAPKPKSPRAKRPAAPRKPRAPKKTPVDPGPPPPLPPEFAETTPPVPAEADDLDDLIIPPKPPLPVPDTGAAEEADAPAAAGVDAEAHPDTSEPEPEPASEVEVEEPEPDVAVDEPEPDLVVEPEPADPGSEAEEALASVFAEPRSEASPESADAALVLRGVTKSFGETRAVDGIDLTVPAGTFYGLVGPNGAGKTTTLSMIAGLLQPDRGAIHVAGVDAASQPLEAKRRLGVLPDRLRTFDRLTGRQLLYYYGVLRGLPSAVVERRTADLARAFDLTDALGRVVSDYSAGMIKKVMLAGAMIHSPRVLVLDEPFEAVDPVSSAVILDILSAYVAHGGTVILSSHGMDLVERVCTRVAVLVAGQVLAEGTVDDVRGELTLEQRFMELAGGLSDVEGLEWLHTFSD